MSLTVRVAHGMYCMLQRLIIAHNAVRQSANEYAENNLNHTYFLIIILS